MTTIYSENNLVYDAEPMTIISTGTTKWDGATFSTAVTWSYNAYFNTATTGNGDPDSHKQVSSSNPFSNSGACCTLASDTTTGLSTHSLLSGTACQPVSGESACNDVDMNGVSRAANGIWDRGALQISGSTAFSSDQFDDYSPLGRFLKMGAAEKSPPRFIAALSADMALKVRSPLLPL